ncbi:MAG: hypothetical protein KAJ19_06715, partial [Gammaproteobacteria bacterium]|nr:hypothetical protein [Gammaproteobacteria bacterium]
MAEMQGNNEQDNTLSADIEGLESFLDEFEEDSSAAVGSQDTAVADDGPLDLDLGEIPELNEVALENGGAEHIDEALTEQSSDEQAGSDLADLNLAIDNSSPLKDTLPSSATAFSSTHPASPISAPGHDNFSIVTFAVAAIAVVASGLMVWWASDLSDQLTTVRSQLIVVNQKAGQADVGGTQDLAMLTQLDERITELSIVIEGPVSH